MNLDGHLTLVKEQRDFHGRQALKYASEPRRMAMHESTSIRFHQLLEDLELIRQWQVAHPNWEMSPSQGSATARLALSWDEVHELPAEVLNELSISEVDKAEFQIVSAIRTMGGVASLDRIIVHVWRETGEVLKRLSLNQRLYRMAQKEVIYSVPGRKGVYSLRPLTEEEAKLLP